MANGMYDYGREGFAGADIDWDTDDIKLVLYTSTYVPNLATDQFLSAILVGNRVATSANFTSKTKTAGVLDADDVPFVGLTGSAVAGMVMYKDTGVAATSRLIACWDTVTGLPFTPTGMNFTVQWSSGANKILKL